MKYLNTIRRCVYQQDRRDSHAGSCFLFYHFIHDDFSVRFRCSLLLSSQAYAYIWLGTTHSMSNILLGWLLVINHISRLIPVDVLFSKPPDLSSLSDRDFDINRVKGMAEWHGLYQDDFRKLQKRKAIARSEVDIKLVPVNLISNNWYKNEIC